MITPPAPPRRVDMRRAASRQQRITPIRLTSTTSRKVSLVKSISVVFGPVTPALLTTAEMA